MKTNQATKISLAIPIVGFDLYFTVKSSQPTLEFGKLLRCNIPNSGQISFKPSYCSPTGYKIPFPAS
jgi:hypothetical protein